MVSAMGDADGKALGGFVLLDQAFKVSRQFVRTAAELPNYAMACSGAASSFWSILMHSKSFLHAQVQLFTASA